MKLFIARLILVVAMALVFVVATAIGLDDTGWVFVLVIAVSACFCWAVIWAIEICDEHRIRRGK